MKRLCFACMCLLLIGTVSPAIADMTGIQILSEQYHVEGYYAAFDYWDESWHSDSYNLDSTNSSGISGSVSFNASNFAESSAGQFFADARAYGNLSITHAIASASLSFQPMTSGRLDATFYVGSWYPEQAHANLSDSTAGVQLFDAWDTDPKVHYGPFHGDWWVDYNHRYSLSLSAFSSQGDPSWAAVDLSFTPVPAPAALMLGGIGLGFVGWLRRRRTL